MEAACILIHTVIALKLFVMRSMFVFIYQSCYRNSWFPKDYISTIKQTQCILRRGNTCRGQFSTPATVLSLFHSSFQPQIQALCTKSYHLSVLQAGKLSQESTTDCSSQTKGWCSQQSCRMPCCLHTDSANTHSETKKNNNKQTQKHRKHQK